MQINIDIVIAKCQYPEPKNDEKQNGSNVLGHPVAIYKTNYVDYRYISIEYISIVDT